MLNDAEAVLLTHYATLRTGQQSGLLKAGLVAGTGGQEYVIKLGQSSKDVLLVFNGSSLQRCRGSKSSDAWLLLHSSQSQFLAAVADPQLDICCSSKHLKLAATHQMPDFREIAAIDDLRVCLLSLVIRVAWCTVW